MRKLVATIAIATLATVGAIAAAGISGANVPMQAETCNETGPGWQDKVETTGNPPSVTVTAPEGFLIDAFCVKAGQFTEIIPVDPPQQTVTISAPTGQAVSHFQIHIIPAPPPTTAAAPPTTAAAPPTTAAAPGAPTAPAAPARAPAAVAAAPRVTG